MMASSNKTYWLNLFTGTTWQEFRAAGAKISGFRAARQKLAAKIKPGDVFLCYLTGVMRWVGSVEVLGPSREKHAIWSEMSFPVQFDVRPLILLEPETGVPMAHLKGLVSFYADDQDAGKFKAFLRGSPSRFQSQEDAAVILGLLEEALGNPVRRPVSQAKLQRKPFYLAEQQVGKKIVQTVVTVPDNEEDDNGKDAETPTGKTADQHPTEHLTIQANLLMLGAEMGLNVWAAKNDRSRLWNGVPLSDLAGMVDELPTQFNEATQETIELIDVLWLKGNSILAAFEIECTTTVYSGLLRMSDLMALQPNLDIKLFIVAPDSRRDKVEREIKRPTFMLRPKPLNKICGFLAFSNLMVKVDGIRELGLAGALSPSFLETTAEYFVGQVETAVR